MPGTSACSLYVVQTTVQCGSGTLICRLRSLTLSFIMPISKNYNYFVLPHIPVMIAVTLGLLLTILCTFKPDVVPYDYLGPLGELAHFLAYEEPVVIRTICITAIFMHVLESLYAYHLAGMKELSSSTKSKWLISTFFFGIFSMYYLLRYNPQKAQKRD